MNYLFYRLYTPLAVIIILVGLNRTGWIIDMFSSVFSGLPEIRRLIATLILTLIVYAVIFVLFFFAAKKLRGVIFKSIPEKPDAAGKSFHIKNSASLDGNTGICQCVAGTSRDLMGTMRFSLPNSGDAVILSMNVVKRDDGEGLLRADCRIGEQLQTCAFRINYCPHCGGSYVVLSQSQEAEEQEIPELVKRSTLTHASKGMA